ncbi:MAG: terminase large subunit [Hyphomicrobiales bacterium]
MAVKKTARESKDFIAVIDAYVSKVTADLKAKVYGINERLACQRHLDDLEKSKSDDFPYYFDPYFVADICNFAEKIKHVDGNWDIPTIVLHETQVFIFGSLIGWRHKADWRVKRFKNAYLGFARKNAKSTNAAILGLYALTKENELGAQVVTAATKTEQAEIVLDMMRRMALALPSMCRQFGLKVDKKKIYCRKGGGVVKALSNDAKTQDGLNPHFAILDEFHAHQKRDLFDVIKSAFGARKNWMMLIITTAGHNLISACYTEYKMCVDILNGKITNDQYFVMVYTIDDGDDIFDERNWRKANPLLGVSIPISNFRIQAQGANDNEANLAEYKTKHMNVFIGGSACWLNMTQFKKCSNPDLMDKLDEHVANNGVVKIGIDLSSLKDMTAVAICWRDEQNKLCAIVYQYLPNGTIMDRKNPNHAQYVLWREHGYLNEIDGARISTNDLEDDIFALIEAVNPNEVVFDFFGGGDQLAAKIEEKYEDSHRLMSYVFKKNTHNVGTATSDLEDRIISGEFEYDGCPVLEWQAGNVHVTRKLDGSLLAKKEDQDSHNKIDGMDAIIHANARLCAEQIENVAPSQGLGGVY